MIKRNYHTHTKRCGHAAGKDEDYVKAAVSAGMEVLGFSDHAPYDTWMPGIRMKMEEFGDYTGSVKALKEKYKDQIEIRLGLEVEALPEEWEALSKYREEMEYIILGQHFLTLDEDSVYDFTKAAQLYEYVRKLEYGVSHHLCDCIAHPDVMMFSYPRIDKDAVQVFTDIADISLRYDVPLELNCGTGCKIGPMRYKDGNRLAYPVREAFEIFAEKKCRVMIGIDAHEPTDFLSDIYLNRALDTVKGLDLNLIEDIDLVKEASERKRRFF